MPDPSSLYRVRIWDLPTRVFHWAGALCVLGLAVTGTVGGSAMVFHFRFGYALLTLLLFRLVWGPAGRPLVALSQLCIRAACGACLLARPGPRQPHGGPLTAWRAVCLGPVGFFELASGHRTDQ